MSYQVILPPLEDGAIEFVVEQYYVDVDVSVVVGQAVALVRSARFAWDIPATMSGIVSRLAAEEDSMVTPGAPLLEIREQGTGDREQGTGNREQEARTTGNREQEEAAAQRVRATPVARRMAARHDINLATLSGTGRGKSITRADVLAVIGNRDEGAGMRAQEAESREQGTRISPQHAALSTQHSVSTFQPSNLPTFQPSNLPYALTATEVDASAALVFIAEHERRARRGVTIPMTACVAAATVAALNEHRMLNSAWSDDGIILRSRVHLLMEQPRPEGTRSGMQAVLVSDAADLNPLGIARRLAQINDEQQVHHGQATFAIGQRREPWWGHTQPNGLHTASLTIGDVTHQPRVAETANGDTIAIRPVVLLVLAYDARVVDQEQADAFLRTVQQRLEHFDRL